MSFPIRPSVLFVAGVTAAASLLVPLATPAGAAAYDKRWEVTGPGIHRSSSTLGDLSVGRVVLSADTGGYLTAIRSDGSVAWRSAVDPRPGVRAAVQSSPAVGDLDGDGRNEVVVGAGSTEPVHLGQPGGVVAFRGDGSVAWRWRSPVDAATWTSPAIGDVDGDGRNDVVFGNFDHNVWALRGTDGSLIPGFPFDNTDTIFSSPALYDIDGDGTHEIIIGGDQTRNDAVPQSYNGGVLRVLKVTGGRVIQRFRVNMPDIVASSPAIGDIDGDGRMEAVVGSGGYHNPPDNRRMWAIHLDDGSFVPGWPQTTDANVFGSPALGDVVPGDGGRLEVVVGDVRGNLYAWRGDGRLLWKTSPGPDNDTFFGGPSIGDLDGDSDQDVAIGYGFGGALLVRGTDGGLFRRVVGGPYASEGVPLIADFGAAIGRRLIVSGWNPAVGGFASGATHAFELPPTSAAPDWPTFRKNSLHLGGPPSVSWVRGDIRLRYNSLGGEAGFLGVALTPELATPVRFGRYNHFRGGSIYWSPATGAWEVHGGIRDKWSQLGWENSLLGFPLTNEIALRGGAFSRFERGFVYWSPATTAHEMHGDIFIAWANAGYENGQLGYPTTDELRTPTKFGAYNHFQGGSIYWSPTTGARPVLGAIRDAWQRSGWENGCLGFPVDSERAVGSGTLQSFQGGSITWTSTGGAVVNCR